MFSLLVKIDCLICGSVFLFLARIVDRINKDFSFIFWIQSATFFVLMNEYDRIPDRNLKLKIGILCGVRIFILISILYGLTSEGIGEILK